MKIKAKIEALVAAKVEALLMEALGEDAEPAPVPAPGTMPREPAPEKDTATIALRVQHIYQIAKELEPNEQWLTRVVCVAHQGQWPLIFLKSPTTTMTPKVHIGDSYTDENIKTCLLALGDLPFLFSN